MLFYYLYRSGGGKLLEGKPNKTQNKRRMILLLLYLVYLVLLFVMNDNEEEVHIYSCVVVHIIVSNIMIVFIFFIYLPVYCKILYEYNVVELKPSLWRLSIFFHSILR